MFFIFSISTNFSIGILSTSSYDYQLKKYPTYTPILKLIFKLGIRGIWNWECTKEGQTGLRINYFLIEVGLKNSTTVQAENA